MSLSVVDGAELPPNALIIGNAAPRDDGSAWWIVDSRERATVLETSIDEDDGWTVLRPPSRLEAGATLRLVWSRTATDVPVITELSRVVSFTTSREEDDEPPDPPQVRSATQPIAPRFGDSCGDYPGGTWARFFVERQDDAVAFRLRNKEGLVIDLQVAAQFDRDNDDAQVFLSSIEEKGGDEEYSVTAIDHAGNESEPTIVPLSLGAPGSCATCDPPTFAALLITALVLRAPSVRRRRP